MEQTEQKNQEVKKKKTEPTSLSKTITVAEQRAQYNECVKKLLSHREIIAKILPVVADEFRGLSVKQILDSDCIGRPEISTAVVDRDAAKKKENKPRDAGMAESENVEDETITEGLIKYDIKFSVRLPWKKEGMGIIINLEVQKNDRPGYPLEKRAVYYASRLISGQKGVTFKKSEYGKIRKVYTIWIRMNVSNKKKKTINVYKLKEYGILGSYRARRRNYDLITIAMIGLSDPGEKSTGERSGKTYKNGGHTGKPVDKAKDLIEMLNVLLTNKLSVEERRNRLQSDHDIPMTVEIEEEVNEMCNLAEALYEEALAEAMVKAEDMVREKVCEDIRKEAREEMRDEVREEVRETGIRTAVEIYTEDSMPDEHIIGKLMKKYELSYETAEAKLNEYRVQPA